MRKAHGEKNPMVFCCKRKLTTRSHLLAHLDFHLNPQELTCTICGKMSKDKYQLRIHMACHTDPERMKQFRCETCSKAFLHYSALKMHAMTHLTREEKAKLKTFICQKCGKGYPTQSFLNHHIRLSHDNTYSRVCHICAKRFKNQPSFNNHVLIAHGPPRANKEECHICHSKFKTPMGLKNHIKRVHEEAGLYYCEHCDKECRTLVALSNHIRFVHTLERVHKCTLCDKAFKTPKQIREHMAMHENTPLYSCPYCDRTFNSNANMYTHRKKMHPKEMEQARLQQQR